MWYRSELKESAKVLMNRNYWKAVLVALILAIISGGGGGGGGGSASYNSKDSFTESGDYHLFTEDMEDYAIDPAEIAVISGIAIVTIFIVLIIVLVSLSLSILVFNPLIVGAQKFLINCRNENSSLNLLTYAFSSNYKNVIKIMFFRGLYTFLWSLLFIIPGIIKSYEYRMIPYILAENPSMSMEDVFARTKAMMDNEKWNTFVLDLSFLGWQILGIITCCILSIFYVNPYYYLTCSELYLVLKQKVDGNTHSNQNPYV